MSEVTADPRVIASKALAEGDWVAARDSFRSALEAEADAPDLMDGLGTALWWIGDAEAALTCRERAYAAYRGAGDTNRAARIALWISSEYSAVWGNASAARGWLARAEGLLAERPPSAEDGWLELARAERAIEPADSVDHAERAREHGLRFSDPDLELCALAELGLAEVSLGRVDAGLARFDEAMAAATGGEAGLETFARVCCKLIVACELAGDGQRTTEWLRVVDAFTRRNGDLPLLGFCRTCCADVFSAAGDRAGAEAMLFESVRELPIVGQQSRCVHPAPRLALIRVMQGRLEEAEQLLAGLDDLPEATGATVALRLARGEARAAVAVLERHLEDLGVDNLLAVPLLGWLVEARLADDDIEGAAEAAGELGRLAAGVSPTRVGAVADLAQGRVAVARGEPGALPLLRRAAKRFTQIGLPLEATRARVDLARATAPTAREVAIDLARAAAAQFETLGAHHEADAVTALLRELGVRFRTGPRALGELSGREREVLALVAEGLSNADIAKRLFISPKTAEHHLGRIFDKLGVRSRTEAAAFALRHPEPGAE